MPELTMMEAAKAHQDTLERAIAKMIVERSPILEDLPFKTIQGAAYRYDQERSLGTISFRGVNGAYTPDHGVVNPQFEPLVIMGGEVTIDNFEIKQMSNLHDLKQDRYRMKSRAMAIAFSETFFEGDTTVDPYAFDGLRKRIPSTSGQYINAGTGGATLTLAMLDQLIDLVVGGPSALYMNKTLRRKVTDLVRTQTGSMRIETTQDKFGKQQTAYNGVPIRIVEREDDGSTILAFDEDDGSSNLDTSSIYAVKYGMDFLHGIQGMSMPSVKDFGETEDGPYHKGRIEWYPGLVIKHPRSVARLAHINNA